MTAALWRDTSLPVADRVEYLVSAMTLSEKVAQLYGVWVGASSDGGEVAPHQHDLEEEIDLAALLPNGLGQLTRPFGSAPVEARAGAVSLMRTQQSIVAANRFGIPAVAHEECLAGFATLGATAYPVPLAWGATFNPAIVERMSRLIGNDLRSVGIHQGLAPVLDVVRDARWGRVEETIGEDPYLVGTIASAYVTGLESSGIIATLKHFVGYSASKAGRNLAPVSVGRRELNDVLLAPFEMVIREGRVRSVMHAYTDIDGVPSAADTTLLTDLLRDTWGFDGTVVADYFGIAFLRLLHGVADTWADAAAAALTAGVDIELPTVKTFGEPLLSAVHTGVLDESIIDRALRRVLRQKVELGLLDHDWSAEPEALRHGAVDLDPPVNRAVAREIAEQSIVLLTNDGTLPIRSPRTIAVIGPNADTFAALLGCYSFPAHVGVQHPEAPVGLELPTLVDALREEFPDSELRVALGTSIDGGETTGIAAAVELARSAEVVILALGDRAGLFGRGTSGEGCDVESLDLPGAQQLLVDAILETGVPAVITLFAGRPYALGRAVTDAAAIVQAFFPGEEGAGAVTGVLSGRVNPSGRLPVSVPATPGSQPTTYLAATLANASDVSNIDPTPAFAFGHGLGFSSIEWTDVTLDGPTEIVTDGTIEIGATVRNAGETAGVEVVQVYLHDPVASVVRPVQRLVAYARVDLEAGAAARVQFSIPADLVQFTGRDGRRVVEPGVVEFRLSRSAAATEGALRATLTGPPRVVDHTRRLHATVEVTSL